MKHLFLVRREGQCVWVVEVQPWAPEGTTTRPITTTLPNNNLAQRKQEETRDSRGSVADPWAKTNTKLTMYASSGTSLTAVQYVNMCGGSVSCGEKNKKNPIIDKKQKSL